MVLALDKKNISTTGEEAKTVTNAKQLTLLLHFSSVEQKLL